MRRLLIATVAGCVIGVPSIAGAHMMSSGLGPFYDGLAHLFVTPEDLLPVVALALLAGLRGPAWGRAVLLCLPAGWLAGSAAGVLLTVPPPAPVVSAAVTIVLGALVAADAKLLLAPFSAVAIGLGLAAGGANSLDVAPSLATGLFIAGGTAAIFVVVSLVSGQVTSVRTDAARIAVRVGGSWIAAIGLLMFGWAMR